jgi:hypothetical protein
MDIEKDDNDFLKKDSDAASHNCRKAGSLSEIRYLDTFYVLRKFLTDENILFAPEELSTL